MPAALMNGFNEKELAQFLVRAKRVTYAAGVPKSKTPERKGFEEISFAEGKWFYLDSYYGHEFFQGQEVVRHNNLPVWCMAYSGGISVNLMQEKLLVETVFKFLRGALKLVPLELPFRGPHYLEEKSSALEGKKLEYLNSADGDITFFRGTEKVLCEGNEVYRLDYVGGLMVKK